MAGRGSSPSCYVLKINDNLDSIYQGIYRTAVISKNGGASGVCISSVRASGSSIKKIRGAAKGVIPFMKLFNDTAVAIDQLGTRVGAITVSLDAWHRDIFDFLDMRKENIDPRLQSQDLFGQIAMNDLFMERYSEAVKNDSHEKDWLIFCPHEFGLITGIEIVDLYGQDFKDAYLKAEELHLSGTWINGKLVSTRDLMKKILETDKETGLPYWFNKDFVNETNPNKHLGTIYCGNLCQESFSTFDEDHTHICNLHSLNLANIMDDETLEKATRLSIKALNQIVKMSTSPLESTKKHNDKFKIIHISANVASSS
jgi:ribonucleoside-diphosphate reductase alpha chain